MTKWRFEISVFGVLVLTYLAGFIVSWALRWMTDKYTPPESPHREGWARLVSNVDDLTKGGQVAGRLLGWLERLLYVAAIWQGALILIPGWMAVKVATKWQSWSGLLDMLKIKAKDPAQRNHAARYIRWRVSQRFLLGNLLNIMLAGLIYFVVTALMADSPPQGSGFSG